MSYESYHSYFLHKSKSYCNDLFTQSYTLRLQWTFHLFPNISYKLQYTVLLPLPVTIFYNLVTLTLAQSDGDFSLHFRWKDFIYGLIFGLTDTWRSKFFCFHSRLKLVDGMCWECELHPPVIISWKTFFTGFLCGFTWCHFQNFCKKELLKICLLLRCIIRLGCLLSSMLKWCLLSWQSRNYIKCEF